MGKIEPGNPIEREHKAISYHGLALPLQRASGDYAAAALTRVLAQRIRSLPKGDAFWIEVEVIPAAPRAWLSR
jgi:hypothetical protein